MSTSPRHPAFYASRRQLWTNGPPGKQKCGRNCLQRLGLGNNCDTLYDVWYTVFVVCSTTWLVFIAVCRYREFKAQSHNPRFGNQWEDVTPLNMQLVSLILSLSLLPLMAYAALSRTGHLANDGVVLGRDILHLQKVLSSCTVFQRIWKNLTNGSSVHLPGDSTTPRYKQAPMGEEELDTLLLRRKGEECYAQFANGFRPFSALFFVLITHTLLQPVCVMEAEQLRNEAISPRYVLHSNLDSVFGDSMLYEHAKRAHQMTGTEEAYERPFPSHLYPIKPSDVSIEFAVFAVALALLTVRFSAPFFFTSRPFSFLFSGFIALTGVFLLVDSATIAVVYKLGVVGIREPGGTKLLDIGDIDSVLSPWHCVILSAACLPAVLGNLLAVFAYGEDQFTRAVTNYAQLLFSGELPTARPFRLSHPAKIACNGNLAAEYVPNGYPGSFIPVETDHSDIGSEMIRETVLGMPLTIAVTTKHWQPPPISSGRRSARLSRRLVTPIPGQYTSNDSVTSGTLKRAQSNGIGAASLELTASAHSVTDAGEVCKAKTPKRNNVGLLLICGITFSWLLVTRICLAGPMLRCFWKTGLKLALADIIVSVLYMICWLLLWFGLASKNAWRFRLLHVVAPLTPKEYTLTNVNQGEINPLGYTVDGPQVQPGYAPIWPCMPYSTWVSQGGLVAEQNESDGNIMQRADSVLPNHLGNGGLEAGSGADSLYGCFPDPPPQQQVPTSEVINQYRSRLPAVEPTAGPPTLSDESDVHPGSVDAMDADPRYFKPVSTPVDGDHNHTLTLNNTYRPSSTRPFSRTSFQMPRSESSRGASLAELCRHAKPRGQKVANAQALLAKHGRTSDTGDPTYAVLAQPPGLHNKTTSVSPHDPSNEDHVVSDTLNRNTSCKRNGSRVTFKDARGNNEFKNNHDGATGSSDSGVYTNGHGSGANNSSNTPDEPSQSGRLKAEVYTMFGEVVTQPMVTGRMQPALSSEKTYYGLQRTDQRPEEVEMSTNLGTFGMTEGRVAGVRTQFLKLQNDVFGNPDDQLCSQV